MLTSATLYVTLERTEHPVVTETASARAYLRAANLTKSPARAKTLAATGIKLAADGGDAALAAEITAWATNR